MKYKVGDNVKIIAGDQKGSSGKIIKIYRKNIANITNIMEFTMYLLGIPNTKRDFSFALLKWNQHYLFMQS